LALVVLVPEAEDLEELAARRHEFGAHVDLVGIERVGRRDGRHPGRLEARPALYGRRCGGRRRSAADDGEDERAESERGEAHVAEKRHGKHVPLLTRRTRSRQARSAAADRDERARRAARSTRGRISAMSALMTEWDAGAYHRESTLQSWLAAQDRKSTRLNSSHV